MRRPPRAVQTKYIPFHQLFRSATTNNKIVLRSKHLKHLYLPILQLKHYGSPSSFATTSHMHLSVDHKFFWVFPSQLCFLPSYCQKCSNRNTIFMHLPSAHKGINIPTSSIHFINPLSLSLKDQQFLSPFLPILLSDELNTFFQDSSISLHSFKFSLEISSKFIPCQSLVKTNRISQPCEYASSS